MAVIIKDLPMPLIDEAVFLAGVGWHRVDMRRLGMSPSSLVAAHQDVTPGVIRVEQHVVRATTTITALCHLLSSLLQEEAHSS